MFDDDAREQVPLEARDIHQQLLDDSSQWVRGLPADTRMAEFARALPQRMPLPSAQDTHNVLAHRRPSSTLPDMMSLKGHTNMLNLQGPRRSIAASIAAVAVVALIVGVLYSMHSIPGTQAGSGGGRNTSTVVVPTPEKTPPPTPGPLGHNFYQTPGPLAKYMSEVQTADSRSTDITAYSTYFHAGDWVYVEAMAKGLPKGTHTISIVWYLNGVRLELSSNQTSTAINGDQRVFFGLAYPTPGVGMAKLYIDRPASDTSEATNDPRLAYTLKFVVAESEGSTPTHIPSAPTATPHP